MSKLRLGTRGSELAPDSVGNDRGTRCALPVTTSSSRSSRRPATESDGAVRLDRPAGRVRSRDRAGARRAPASSSPCIRSRICRPRRRASSSSPRCRPRADPADLLLVRARGARRQTPTGCRSRAARASARRRRAGACGSRTSGRTSPSSRCAATCRRASASSTEGAFDAIVLAAAGVDRLQADARLDHALDGIDGAAARPAAVRARAGARRARRAMPARRRRRARGAGGARPLGKPRRRSPPSATRWRAPKAAATSRSAPTAR